jgi:hypothetical protein
MKADRIPDTPAGSCQMAILGLRGNIASCSSFPSLLNKVYSAANSDIIGHAPTRAAPDVLRAIKDAYNIDFVV